MTPNYPLRFYQSFPHLVDLMKSTQHQSEYHLEGSVWTHSLMAYQHALAKHGHVRQLLLIALMHDLGKCVMSQIRSIDLSTTALPGHPQLRRSFKNHEGLSFLLASNVLHKLETDLTTSEATEVLQAIGLHGVNVSQLTNIPYLVMFRAIDHAARITPTPPSDSHPFKFAQPLSGPLSVTLDIGPDHGYASRQMRKSYIQSIRRPMSLHAVVHIPNIDDYPLSQLTSYFQDFIPPVLQEGFASITYDFGAIHG